MSSQNDFIGRIKNNWRQRAGEKITFGSELKVIPRWLFRLLGGLYVLALAIQLCLDIYIPGKLRQPLPTEPPALNIVATFAIVTAAAMALSAIILLFGYIGADAKRRGMSPVLWVLVSLLVPYLIGVIIYFVVRDPLPFNCPQCGHPVNAHFNFCPNCRLNLRPNCPQCRREIRPGDRFCPQCGFALEPAAPAPPAPAEARAV